MQIERDPLNLRSLPLVSPPGDDWPVIEAALRKSSGRERIKKTAISALAAAALVVLAVGIYIRQPLMETTGITDFSQLADSPVTKPAAKVISRQDNLESLITLSQGLESKLRQIRSEIGFMPINILAYQVELEDLVAQVDDALSNNPESVGLWSQRVNLLLNLSQLYQNELRRDYQSLASL